MSLCFNEELQVPVDLPATEYVPNPVVNRLEDFASITPQMVDLMNKWVNIDGDCRLYVPLEGWAVHNPPSSPRTTVLSTWLCSRKTFAFRRLNG